MLRDAKKEEAQFFKRKEGKEKIRKG